jgi:hypothetical protein
MQQKKEIVESVVAQWFYIFVRNEPLKRLKVVSGLSSEWMRRSSTSHLLPRSLL